MTDRKHVDSDHSPSKADISSVIGNYFKRTDAASWSITGCLTDIRGKINKDDVGDFNKGKWGLSNQCRVHLFLTPSPLEFIRYYRQALERIYQDVKLPKRHRDLATNLYNGLEVAMKHPNVNLLIELVKQEVKLGQSAVSL
jgi:hypothetical protein